MVVRGGFRITLINLHRVVIKGSQQHSRITQPQGDKTSMPLPFPPDRSDLLSNDLPPLPGDPGVDLVERQRLLQLRVVHHRGGSVVQPVLEGQAGGGLGVKVKSNYEIFSSGELAYFDSVGLLPRGEVGRDFQHAV